MLKISWWKYLVFLILIYTIIGGFLVKAPMIDQLEHTIRNLFFHVPMWFTMTFVLLISFINSLRYLAGFNLKYDIIASQAAHIALLFGVLGLLTGMVWAKYTWGDFWVKDPKLNGAATGLLIYFAYWVLRGAVDDEEKRAKLAAVYNIFAFALFIVFIGVLPRIVEESIHPGKDGNPALPMNMDPQMRWVFYPAVLGWILLALWLLNIRMRLLRLKYKLENFADND